MNQLTMKTVNNTSLSMVNPSNVLNLLS